MIAGGNCGAIETATVAMTVPQDIPVGIMWRSGQDERQFTAMLAWFG